MAHKVCSADGSFTGSVWSAVDGTALISTNTGQTALTTSYTSSANFNPTAIQIDAIYVKVGYRAAGVGTNIMTVSLWDVTAAAEVVAQSVAVADIPIGNSSIGNLEDESGWMCLKLGSTPTLANNNHLIRIKLNATTTAVSVRTNGTASNWQHMLRTTAAATTPSAGDDLYIVGEYTTTATWTTRTLTYDDTAGTDWGSARVNSGAEFAPALYIGQYGAVNCGVTASTNYTLRVSGWIGVAPLGTFTWGTATTAMPTTCATYILLDNGASTVYGIGVSHSATFEVNGSPRTAGKLVTYCVLAADITSSSSWTVDTDTGWKSGDVVAMNGRGTTAALQSFLRTLSGDAGASTLATTVNSPQGPYYGTGDEPARQRIILMTRNIRIYCTTIGQACPIRSMTWLSPLQPTKFNLVWTQIDDGVIINLDDGVSLTTPNGPTTCEIAYCSIYRTSGAAGSLLIAAGYDKFSIHDCGIYIAANLAINTWTASSSLLRYTFSFYNIVAFGQATNSGGALNVLLAYTTGTVSNIWAGTQVSSISLIQPTAGAFAVLNAGTYSGLTAVYNNGFSFTNGGFVGATFTNWKAYRGNATGLSASSIYAVDTTWEDLVIKGCGTQGLLFGNTSRFKNVRFKNATLGSETSPANFTQPRGVEFNTLATGIVDVWDNVWFDGCSLGTGSTHSICDVSFGTPSSGANLAWITSSGFRNCNLYSANELIGVTDSRAGDLVPFCYVPGSNISFIREDGTHGESTTYLLPGANKRIRNSAIYRTAAPSEELQVVNATASTSPCYSSVRGVALSSGSTVTVSLYMRVSSTYTGSAPVVYQAPNGAIGWYNAAVIGTYAGTAGQADTFVAVTCSTSSTASDAGIGQFYVAAFGTVGSVYLDDWSFVVT